MRSSLHLLLLLGGFHSLTEAKPLDQPSVTFLSPSEVSPGSAHNVVVEYGGSADGEITITYGPCDGAPVVSNAKQRLGSTHVGDHPLAARHVDHADRRPTKFVWLTPADASGGCLGAFIDGELAGQSEELRVARRMPRRSAKRSFAQVAGDDSMWFNGVVYLDYSWTRLASTTGRSWSRPSVSAAASGLYISTAPPPRTASITNFGPMRFPVEITDPETNETFPFNDQRVIFQLADILNELNAGNESVQVRFGEWIQSSPNTPVDSPFRRPDGTFPGRAEVTTDPAYANPTKQAKEDGMFDYSEVSYLRGVIKTDLNTTDEVTPSHLYWPMWEYETVYFLATKWLTVKGGLSRLPAAFEPLTKARTVSVSWKPTGADPFDTPEEVESFDYVLNSVPLNLLKFWDLPPYSSLLRRAIDRTLFGNAVKVAVQFKTRFWERLERPIFGGCARLATPQLGQVCYPSWDLNATGPGTMLASYLSDHEATVACSMSEQEHLAYVKKALVRVHGDVVEENWTGVSARHCWEQQDEHHAGAFTMQILSQQHLYLPAFYQTQFNTVFIGEAATFTHTWTFSALESALRGTVQLLLDMGLVDEAKQITKTWMARFIEV
ncbi:hypothetical protein LX36DRAFT_672817 [Colletotrichum falcatum]|nr:hypothetical protein LX36DRAFT_672817 [Colletotrichum falcatum]